ncbi:MAG: GtrA family protein [Alphaproteobacteria bacterium]
MWHKLLKYGTIGIINAAIDFGFYSGFIHFFHIHPLLSNIFAWAAAVQFSYVMNALITFKQSVEQMLSFKKWILFILSGIASLMASTLTLWLLLPYLGTYGAKIAATIASFIVGFSISHILIFKEK